LTGGRGPGVAAKPPPSVAIRGPLRAARFLDRPNRFLVRCRLEEGGEGAGATVEAHLPDPGRLRELLLPAVRIWLRPARSPARRTRWSAVLVDAPGGEGLVSVDTTLPNRLVRAALEEDALRELRGWGLRHREWRHDRSRFDFLLEDRHEERFLVLEVKSVTLVEDGTALFPDAITARGARHVRELADFARRPGWEAAVLFVLQRPDADRIVAARAIDPAFADALAEAGAAGVRILGRRCSVTKERVTLGGSVPATVE